jgi:hypothetical protein
MNKRLLAAIFPPANVGRERTGLTFTDILFGLVISELFLRAQIWLQLPTYTRWHLGVGLALVLGSWIGFRRSVHRTEYELKFFNLPLFRFLMDQAMVLLYFRIAVLTPLTSPQAVAPGPLAERTLAILLYVFALYVLWDVFGIWMAYARVHDGLRVRRSKYSRLKDRRPTGERQAPNWAGLLITLTALGLLVALRVRFDVIDPDTPNAVSFLIAATVLLLLYRWAKEIRTSWRSL